MDPDLVPVPYYPPTAAEALAVLRQRCHPAVLPVDADWDQERRIVSAMLHLDLNLNLFGEVIDTLGALYDVNHGRHPDLMTNRARTVDNTLLLRDKCIEAVNVALHDCLVGAGFEYGAVCAALGLKATA